MQEHKKFHKDPRVPTKHTLAIATRAQEVPFQNLQGARILMLCGLSSGVISPPSALQGVNSSALGVLRGAKIQPFPSAEPACPWLLLK